VRPETVAFRELDTLVRNLSDQLAGYRRRALTAEARARELEQILAGMTGKLDEQARTLQLQLDGSRTELHQAKSALSEALAKGTPEARDLELARENERLRARLDEARERTTQLAERVRFLRQQVTQPADR